MNEKKTIYPLILKDKDYLSFCLRIIRELTWNNNINNNDNLKNALM